MTCEMLRSLYSWSVVVLREARKSLYRFIPDSIRPLVVVPEDVRKLACYLLIN